MNALSVTCQRCCPNGNETTKPWGTLRTLFHLDGRHGSTCCKKMKTAVLKKSGLLALVMFLCEKVRCIFVSVHIIASIQLILFILFPTPSQVCRKSQIALYTQVSLLNDFGFLVICSGVFLLEHRKKSFILRLI